MSAPDGLDDVRHITLMCTGRGAHPQTVLGAFSYGLATIGAPESDYHRWHVVEGRARQAITRTIDDWGRETGPWLLACGRCRDRSGRRAAPAKRLTDGKLQVVLADWWDATRGDTALDLSLLPI